jgi:hypothetical protein
MNKKNTINEPVNMIEEIKRISITIVANLVQNGPLVGLLVLVVAGLLLFTQEQKKECATEILEIKNEAVTLRRAIDQCISDKNMLMIDIATLKTRMDNLRK